MNPASILSRLGCLLKQAYMTCLESIIPSRACPTETLGAWKHPQPFPWGAWLLVLVISSLISIETTEAWRLYQLRLRIEKSVVLSTQKKVAINTSLINIASLESKVNITHLLSSLPVKIQPTENTLNYQNEASILSWQKLGQELAYDPAALFITLENSLNADIALLSFHLNENKQKLTLRAEAKNIEAVEIWRKNIAKQPLLEASQLTQEKWMPSQNGITPNQFTLDISLNWDERIDALNSRPPKMILKTKKENVVKKNSLVIHKPKTTHVLPSAKRVHL